MTHYTGMFYGDLMQLHELINRIQFEMKGSVKFLIPLDLKFPKGVEIETLPLPSPNNQIVHAFNKIPLQRQIFKLLNFATQRGVKWGAIEPYHDTRRGITTSSPQLTIMAIKRSIHGTGEEV